jgi:hypothetical protein
VTFSSKLAGWIGLGSGESGGTKAGEPSDNPAAAQRNAAAGVGVPFPRFRASASDQIGMQADSSFARARMKLLEYFTPSQPVSDRKRFAGRSDVLGSVIRAIEEQRLHVIVYGERGLGKTSVMHVLTQAARDARYLVVYVSCGADSSFDEVFRTVAAHVPMLFHSTVGPTSPEVEKGKTLAELLPSTPISPRMASDMLAKVVGTRVVVVLDEFDRSHSMEFRQGIAELIKNLSDRLVRVQLVIAGVAGNLTELLEHIPSIQRNIFALQMPWMPPAEIRALIRNGGQMCGLSFDEASENAIVSTAHGSPYLATLLGHHAGMNAIDGQRVRVGVPDVTAAITAAAGEFYGRMSGKMRDQLKHYIGDSPVDLLGNVAGVSLLSNGTFRSEDLWAGAAGLGGAERAESVVADLVRVGLLVESSAEGVRRYRFFEDGIASYLWLQSAAQKLRTEQRPVAASAATAALAQNKKQN